jgi:hypothetical protein
VGRFKASGFRWRSDEPFWPFNHSIGEVFVDFFALNALRGFL